MPNGIACMAANLEEAVRGQLVRNTQCLSKDNIRLCECDSFPLQMSRAGPILRRYAKRRTNKGRRENVKSVKESGCSECSAGRCIRRERAAGERIRRYEGCPGWRRYCSQRHWLHCLLTWRYVHRDSNRLSEPCW